MVADSGRAQGNDGDSAEFTVTHRGDIRIRHEAAKARRMWFTSCFCVFVACLVPVARAQSPDVRGLLSHIKAADSEQLAVSEEDGRFLRLMIVTSGARRA